MTVLSGARVVTPLEVLDPGTVVLDGDRIAEVRPGQDPRGRDLTGHVIVPGFVDVHVHGVGGIDTLAAADAVDRVAVALPRFGVTAFCPTTVACSPRDLATVLGAVGRLRLERPGGAARVLGAHLESNFINPDYRGAQPLACLRHPPSGGLDGRASSEGLPRNEFTGRDVLDEIERAGSDVAIVTMAPELPGALELIRHFVAQGRRVSLGHSGATYEQGLAGIEAGARHATHLFNRMPPFSHRAPGLVGAILDRDEVSAELIVDGYHVHPATVRAVLKVLGPDRAIAITDGTAASGLPRGAVTQLGAERLTVGDVALLDDGTWAGSTLTMDAAFRNLVTVFGCSLVEAARLCATTPARAVGFVEGGALAPGACADVVVLDAELRVVQTYVAGVPIDAPAAARGNGTDRT